MAVSARAQDMDTRRKEPELCDVCGAPAIEVHCKIICWTCGYTRDCSDP